MFILNIEPVATAFVGLLALSLLSLLSLLLMHDADGLDFRRREVSAARRKAMVAAH
ncbi:hypothetical protein JGU71_24355 [Antrihabitans sp. YC3-6]|uniref:Uncharacterized protein n=1 Tax=Antrihabitans stalagmiti TaxID=2799499 RepID=A0A934NVG1_9NOCA|nr:hypothetical protein [Antrihabitans stalagmiti]MBJ8342025.1 hypothetical protein [Antrihabitans stalagmiti]